MTKLYCYDTTSADQPMLDRSLQNLNPVFIAEPLSLATVRPDAEIISVFVSSTVTSEIMAAMPHLKLIATRSTGYDHIDVAAAHKHGIIIATVPSYGEHTVAEYAFALLLALQRKVVASQRHMTSGDITHDDLVGHELFGQTLGVVGTGRIGANAARIGRGFGMTVIAYDPHPNEAVAREVGFTYAPLDEVLAAADVVTLHVPALPQTRHLIGAAQFKQMKSGAVIVNTARGEVIATDALIDALGSGHLGGAALDVVENEQLASFNQELAVVRQHALHEAREALRITTLERFGNVIMTNHNAYNTAEAAARIAGTTADNIRAFQAGQPQNTVPRG